MVAPTKKHVHWSISTALVFVLLFGLVGPIIPYKEVRNWICPISGSTRTQVTWFGSFSSENRTVSALEKWLSRREVNFTPNWRNFSTQTYFLLGRSCAAGGTPPIYYLKPMLESVVEKLSDEQIAHLVSDLRHGSPDEQRQLIQKIGDQVFDRQ